MNLLDQKMKYWVKLDESIKALNKKELAPGAEKQLDRLMNIAVTDHNEFFVMGSDFAVYEGNERRVNMNGEKFTLDVKKLSTNFDFYKSAWYVPTKEGALVDIWLL